MNYDTLATILAKKLLLTHSGCNSLKSTTCQDPGMCLYIFYRKGGFIFCKQSQSCLQQLSTFAMDSFGFQVGTDAVPALEVDFS